MADPEAARPTPEAAEALGRLVERIGLVAVVSGRPVEFLASVLPGDPRLVLAGQHGLERVAGGRYDVDPRLEPWRAAVAAAAEAAGRAGIPGLLIERKGDIAVNLHWRTVPERAAEAEAYGRRLAEDLGLDALPMRMALELRPPLPVDKGTVIDELAAGRAAALVAGDDHGDLAAFAALGRLVDAGRCGHAVRVAVRSDEAPAALLEAADHQVDGPAGLAALLTRLAGLVDAARAVPADPGNPADPADAASPPPA